MDFDVEAAKRRAQRRALEEERKRSERAARQTKLSQELEALTSLVSRFHTFALRQPLRTRETYKRAFRSVYLKGWWRKERVYEVSDELRRGWRISSWGDCRTSGYLETHTTCRALILDEDGSLHLCNGPWPASPPSEWSSTMWNNVESGYANPYRIGFNEYGNRQDSLQQWPENSIVDTIGEWLHNHQLSWDGS